jgi:hypothetical protein
MAYMATQSVDLTSQEETGLSELKMEVGPLKPRNLYL